MAAIVLAALLIGAMLGHVAGLAVRSDNLPFFALVGAVAGACAGLGAAALHDREGAR